MSLTRKLLGGVIEKKFPVFSINNGAFVSILKHFCYFAQSQK